MLFQSCQEGGVRLPVRRADQLRDAREEADPVRDEHAHSGPRVHQEVIRPTLVFCFNYDLLYWYYILIKHHTDITTSVILLILVISISIIFKNTNIEEKKLS